MLLSLRPRFNRAGIWAGPKRFLGRRRSPRGLELAILDTAQEAWTCAGPFGTEVRFIQEALVRLLWYRFYPQTGLAGMPTGWFDGAYGPEICVPHRGGSDGGSTAFVNHTLAIRWPRREE